ncbi:hypothetical protein FQA39_LY10643 [Lamprigera yunnana]|nr:hypothetical protein FQA39_LY10643 [Lamprigera yunnana]
MYVLGNHSMEHGDVNKPSVKCGLCGNVITYTSSKVGLLGEHLFKSHSKQRLALFVFDNENISSHHLSLRKKLDMYRATVETWKPGIAVIQCSSCGRSARPIVRKQQNKVAESALGAACLLGCWPLCFLPFILSGSHIMNIHCKFCGQYLGTFDRKTGEMRRIEDNLESRSQVKSELQSKSESPSKSASQSELDTQFTSQSQFLSESQYPSESQSQSTSKSWSESGSDSRYIKK